MARPIGRNYWTLHRNAPNYLNGTRSKLPLHEHYFPTTGTRTDNTDKLRCQCWRADVPGPYYRNPYLSSMCWCGVQKRIKDWYNSFHRWSDNFLAAMACFDVWHELDLQQNGN